MGAYHHIYMNNPTAGDTDGTMVSEGHVLTAPVSATLNAANNEEKIIKLAIRCDAGFKSVGDVSIVLGTVSTSDGKITNVSTGGGNTGKWAISKDISTAGSMPYTINSNPVNGNQGTFGDVELTAGTDFQIASEINNTAANMAAAINSKSKFYKATVSGATITVTEKYPGGGHTPSAYAISNKGYIACSFGTQTASLPATETDLKSKGLWGDTLTINDTEIEDKNVIFWVKVKATSDEAPQRDDSTALLTSMTVSAV